MHLLRTFPSCVLVLDCRFIQPAYYNTFLHKFRQYLRASSKCVSNLILCHMLLPFDVYIPIWLCLMFWVHLFGTSIGRPLQQNENERTCLHQHQGTHVPHGNGTYTSVSGRAYTNNSDSPLIRIGFLLHTKLDPSMHNLQHGFLCANHTRRPIFKWQR